MEILFRLERFPHGKILPRNPLPRPPPPPPPEKIPLKMFLYFPITSIICKQWVKFITWSPSPGDCGGIKASSKI